MFASFLIPSFVYMFLRCVSVCVCVCVFIFLLIASGHSIVTAGFRTLGKCLAGELSYLPLKQLNENCQKPRD